MLLTDPAAPMAVFIVGVVDAQIDRVEAVIGGTNIPVRLVLPALPHLLAMLTGAFAACLGG